MILTGRSSERLQHAASEVHALSTAALDAADSVALERFFRSLPAVDHVMVTAGRPYYGRLADMDFAKIRGLIGEHLLQALYVARSVGMSIAGAVTAALPALTGATYDIDGGQQFVAA